MALILLSIKVVYHFLILLHTGDTHCTFVNWGSDPPPSAALPEVSYPAKSLFFISQGVFPYSRLFTELSVKPIKVKRVIVISGQINKTA